MIGHRWRIPDSPLRTSVVVTNAVALVALIALAVAARARLPLTDLYPVKASILFVAMMLVGVGFVPDHHRFAHYGLANQVTTVRAMLAALVASLVGEPRLPIIAASAAAAALTVTALDAVDGWLARRSRMASAFGARFDMEVDALLMMALSILVWQYGKAGPWVLLSGLARYVFLGAGWLRPWLNRPLMPSRRRQAICVVQIAGLTLAIAPTVTPPASAVLAAVALAALVYSFLVDVVWLWRQPQS